MAGANGWRWLHEYAVDGIDGRIWPRRCSDVVGGDSDACFWAADCVECRTVYRGWDEYACAACGFAAVFSAGNRGKCFEDSGAQKASSSLSDGVDSDGWGRE